MALSLRSIIILSIGLVATKSSKIIEDDKSTQKIDPRSRLLGTDLLQNFQDIINQKLNTKATTLQYYQSLLQRLKPTVTTRTTTLKKSEITDEDITFLVNHLKNELAQSHKQNPTDPPKLMLSNNVSNLQQQQQQQQLQQLLSQPNLQSFNNDISLIDFLNLQLPTPTTQITTPVPTTTEPIPKVVINHQTDPNEYANIPYIPAIHGSQSSGVLGGDQKFFSDMASEIPNVSSQQQTDTTTPTASNTRFSTSLSSCLTESTCVLLVSLLVSAATTGAIGIPFLFGKRKKRSTTDYQTEHRNVRDLINQYDIQTDNNNKTASADSVFHLLSGIEYPEDHTDTWKSHQDSANFLSDSKVDKDSIRNETNNNMTDNVEESLKYRNISEPKQMVLSLDAKFRSNLQDDNDNSSHNSKPNIFSFNTNSSTKSVTEGDADQDKEDHLSNPASLADKTFVGRDISSSKSYLFEPRNDAMVHVLRSNLFNYFSEIENLKHDINLSSNPQKQERLRNSSNKIKNHRDSILSTLKIILNKDLANTDLINYMQTSGLHTILSTINNDTPLENISLSKLVQNSVSQHEKETRPPSITQTQFIPHVTKQEPSLEYNSKLIELLNKFPLLENEEKNSNKPSGNGNLVNLFFLNQLKRPTEEDEQPRPILVSTSSQSPLKRNNSQSIVPVGTMEKILQNPNRNLHDIKSILLQLPQLINGPLLQPTKINPFFVQTIVPKPVTQAAPSIIETIYSQEKTQSDNSTPPQTISEEANRFYTILCKAILEPDIPLNRITAYIAEKCLVMRYTGLLKE